MVSVLIPVYNQYTELSITLEALAHQDYNEPFEVVIVDDKSSNISWKVIKQYSLSPAYSLVFIQNTMNRGRAATRNVLINQAHGDKLIFCDADRFPLTSFVRQHVVALQENPHCASIGKVMETYDTASNILKSLDAQSPYRKAVYYKVIEKLFDKNGRTNSKLSWLAFLSGNLAIQRDDLQSEYFDEMFVEWGFEHFELGYRLVQKRLQIVLNSGASNVHIAHSRNAGDYASCIQKSYHYFYGKHHNADVKPLYDFIVGNISLQEYERRCDGVKPWMEGKKELFNVIINM